MSIEKSDSTKFDRFGIFVLMIACLGQFLVVLDASIVNIALPKLLTALHFTGNSLHWIINSYTAMFASFLLIGGILTDRFGAKKVFIIGNFIFCVASLVAGFLTEPYDLVIARSIQGVSAGLIAPSTLSLITLNFGKDRNLRGKAFGIWSAFASAGGAVGVLAGGVITQWFNWEWIFWVNVPITLILISLMFNYGHSTELKRKGHKGITKALSVAFLFATSLFLIMFTATDFPKENTLIEPALYFVIALALLCVFWKLQLKLPPPIFPKELTNNHYLHVGNMTAFISSGAIFSTYYFLTLMLSFKLNLSPMSIGLSYVPMTMAMFISARFTGNKLINKFSTQNTNIIGVAFSFLGLLVMVISENTSYITEVVIMGTVLLGIGQGIVTTTSSILATTEVDWQLVGTASALVNAFRQVGGAIFLSFIVTLTSFMTSGDLLTSQHGFSYALMTTAALLFILIIILMVYKMGSLQKCFELTN